MEVVDNDDMPLARVYDASVRVDLCCSCYYFIKSSLMTIRGPMVCVVRRGYLIFFVVMDSQRL